MFIFKSEVKSDTPYQKWFNILCKRAPPLKKWTVLSMARYCTCW